MQRAVGAETETILAQRDVAGIIAIEILAQDFLGALADAPAQGVADADAFSRDPESHFGASIGLVLRGIAKFGFGTPVRNRHYPDLAGMQSSRRSVAGAIGGCGGRRQRITEHALLVAAALYRRRNSHRFAILRHRAASNINAGFAQPFHDGVVG